MAAVIYTKKKWQAEVDIRQLPNGRFQGLVLIKNTESDQDDPSPRTVNSVTDTAAEALEEAKALAHRLLADL
jgi:hypothetical protein